MIISRPMDSRTRGEKFSQLARLLFDSAANKWDGAVLLEVGAGVFAAVIGVSNREVIRPLSEPSRVLPFLSRLTGYACGSRTSTMRPRPCAVRRFSPKGWIGL